MIPAMAYMLGDETKTALKQAHEAWMARIKARGEPTFTYTVACCGTHIEGRLTGSPNEKWDTTATCYGCGAVYVKKTFHDRIETYVPERTPE